MTAATSEREYVSQFSAGRTFGILVRVGGVAADADGAVTATLVNETTNVVAASWSTDDGSVTHPETGAYAVTLTDTDTDTVGPFRIDFVYSAGGAPASYSIWLNIGAADPAYDALAPGFQDIIDSVWERFADLFDSPYGGPHLQVYFQTRFGRGRLAKLLKVAVGRLNTVAQPYQTYTTDGTNPFPFAQWGALLEHALYVEVIKHLIRSYTEVAEVALASGVSRLDRRDYMQRWQAVLDMEVPDLQREMDTFKIANMGLGRPHVMVAGGVFGTLSPVPVTGAWEGRPRFYPVSYGI